MSDGKRKTMIVLGIPISFMSDAVHFKSNTKD